MLQDNFILLLSATARSGKDSMCNAFIKSLAEKNILAKRYAFADELKRQLDPLLLLNHGISAFTEDSVEKPLIRNLMIQYGKMCRQIDKDYWAKVVAKKIAAEEKPHVAILSDCRYTSEVDFFRDSGQDNFLLHITRLDDNGEKFPPIGEDEEKYNPLLEIAANYTFVWNNCRDNADDLYYKGQTLLNDLFSHKFSEWKTNYPTSI